MDNVFGFELVPRACQADTSLFGPHGLPSGFAFFKDNRDMSLDSRYWNNSISDIVFPCTKHLPVYSGNAICGVNSRGEWYKVQKSKYQKASGQWLEKWDVRGSGGIYAISRKADGTFGCSCPKWKFNKGTKIDCKHILPVKGMLAFYVDKMPVGVNDRARPVTTEVRCSQCGLRFTNRKAMVIHKSIHAAELELKTMGEAVFPTSRVWIDTQVEVEQEVSKVRRKFRE